MHTFICLQKYMLVLICISIRPLSICLTYNHRRIVNNVGAEFKHSANLILFNFIIVLSFLVFIQFFECVIKVVTNKTTSLILSFIFTTYLVLVTYLRYKQYGLRFVTIYIHTIL